MEYCEREGRQDPGRRSEAWLQRRGGGHQERGRAEGCDGAEAPAAGDGHVRGRGEDPQGDVHLRRERLRLGHVRAGHEQRGQPGQRPSRARSGAPRQLGGGALATETWQFGGGLRHCYYF